MYFTSSKNFEGVVYGKSFVFLEPIPVDHFQILPMTTTMKVIDFTIKMKPNMDYLEKA